ncbi:MAG: Eco57I restriction-modification methylase domain-containing protein [Rhodoblastus sp.]
MSRKRATSSSPVQASPVQAADAAGAAYAATVTADHRKNHGLYLTAPAIAAFMARQIRSAGETIRILNPAAGAGILLCAVVEALSARNKPPRRIELVAYEVDPDLAQVLASVLGNLQEWAANRGIAVDLRLRRADFVLAHAEALRSMGGFFPHPQPEQAFDVVIANPPYFKLNKADPRAQAASAVVHGQPNIYGLFMAIGAALLRDGGELVFITPRSFASGPYFRLFREKFFDCIRPDMAHVFDSRRDAFGRDEVLQENIIIKGVRHDGWPRELASGVLTISSSHGVGDLDQSTRRAVSLRCVLDMQSADKVLRLPVTESDDRVMRLVESWTGSLRRYGLQVSTGPVVPFRATEFLDKSGDVPRSHVPFLWMNHVQAMQVAWPIGRHKPEFIKHSMESLPILVPNRNYVLMRRFSAKEEVRRLVAAPYFADMTGASMLGLENHLNYVYRPNGALTEDEAVGLAALFSSSLLDTYFRISNGSTQVNATELRAMPLPRLEIIAAIGREARATQATADDIDPIVFRHVGATAQPRKASAIG